ncbi:fatty acid synthase Fas domain protein [Bifidobacterium longum subsp. longum CECT 7347]|nr:fatty acid synthase Fas domain protein [Bifidobacterium longum subsp. longum CECT 7347]
MPPSPTCPSRLPMPSACSWPTPPRCASTRSAATTPPTP